MEIVLSVLGVVVGIAGLAYGVYQNRLRSRATHVLQSWGATVCDTLETVNRQVCDLRDRCNQMDCSTLGISGEHIGNSLSQIRDHLGNALTSVRKLIWVATSDAEQNKGAADGPRT